jgi:hypothetical protein
VRATVAAGTTARSWLPLPGAITIPARCNSSMTSPYFFLRRVDRCFPLPRPPNSVSYHLQASSIAGVHLMPGPAQAPARLDTPPTPLSPSLDLLLPQPSRSDPRCCDLFGLIHRPFGRIASSRLDLSLSWPSRPDPSFPFYSAAGPRAP